MFIVLFVGCLVVAWLHGLLVVLFVPLCLLFLAMPGLSNPSCCFQIQIVTLVH